MIHTLAFRKLISLNITTLDTLIFNGIILELNDNLIYLYVNIGFRHHLLWSSKELGSLDYHKVYLHALKLSLETNWRISSVVG